MKHKLATLFLYLAHKLEPQWIEGILKVKDEETRTPEPQQTPLNEQWHKSVQEKAPVDMIAEDRHFPDEQHQSVFDKPPTDE